MELFKNRRIRKYLQAVDVFVALTFSPEPPAEKIKYSSRDVQYSLPKATDTPKDDVRSQNIKYSFSPEETDTQESPKRSPYSIYGSDIGLIDPPTTDNEIPNHGDSFKAASVSSFLSQNTNSPNLSRLASKLDNYLDLTFVDMLTRYINEKGWRDSRVYKAAQLDRRLFSKIMSDRNYKPSKDTALALIIALELSLKQTNDLLSRAGYTLSHSSKRDVIIEYFIRERIYNLADINEVLYRLDQKSIGR